MKLGPNVKALLAERWSQLVVKRSTHEGGEFGKMIGVILRMSQNNGQAIVGDMHEAHEWVKNAITRIRIASPEWRDKTDEEIAGELMRLVKERKAKK